MTTQAEAIRTYILKHIERHPSNIVAITSSHFSVTRTTVHRHLNNLLKDNLIIKSGTTRAIKYFNTNSLNREISYKITKNLSELNALDKDFDSIFKKLPENIYDICTYGFTEIFNNAIDHSGGSKITVFTSLEKKHLTLKIIDNGEGIFKHIADYFKLDDLRESILELNKGKMTTDPANHTGEGIFFCARVFGIFEIYANNIHYIRDNYENDWSIENVTTPKSGSHIIMSIHLDSEQHLVDIFKKYQEPENLAFDRTEILVELSQFGNEKLISRSQAKRITRGLEKFKHVTLDFTRVKLAGQGFVDEIFRVYANKHPKININYINANDDVEFMIKRGLATARLMK